MLGKLRRTLSLSTDLAVPLRFIAGEGFTSGLGFTSPGVNELLKAAIAAKFALYGLFLGKMVAGIATL